MATLPKGYVNYVPAIRYMIDGVDIFQNYGVVVENSNGIISAPPLKQRFAQNWDDTHGEVADVSAVYFEPKDFSLQCWMLGMSSLDITEKLNLFYNTLRTSGLKKLMVFVDANKPLVYQVYLKNAIDVKKQFTVDNVIVAEFTISFREPEPLKRILFGNVADGIILNITLTCTKPVNIRWGKCILGSAMVSGQEPDSFDIVGENLSFSQSYGVDAAKAYPVISGDIDSISSISLTGLATLWSKLL